MYDAAMYSLARVEPEDIELAHGLVAACGRALRERLGLRHWDPPYPRERMLEEAMTREVWLVRDGAAAVATFTLGADPIPRYPDSVFDPAIPSIYVNRLAVAPPRWGAGIGRFCMREVEQRAKAVGARAVRLDSVSAHARGLVFYRRLGYEERGPFVVATHDVVCFEKRIA
jgi:GNAT superfamily N-acetyltransferase